MMILQITKNILNSANQKDFDYKKEITERLTEKYL